MYGCRGWVGEGGDKGGGGEGVGGDGGRCWGDGEDGEGVRTAWVVKWHAFVVARAAARVRGRGGRRSQSEAATAVAAIAEGGGVGEVQLWRGDA